MFIEDGKSGKDYDQFQKAISISVLGFDFIGDTQYFYSTYRIREDQRHTAYSDLLEFHIIELNKLKGCTPTGGDQALYKWACLMNAKSEEEAKMIEKDPYIEEALKEIERLSMDPKRREGYEIRDKSLRDYTTMMNYSKREGIKEGKREGIKEGKIEGKIEGMEAGAAKMAKLTQLLIQENEIEKLMQATKDSTLREELFREYHIE